MLSACAAPCVEAVARGAMKIPVMVHRQVAGAEREAWDATGFRHKALVSCPVKDCEYGDRTEYILRHDFHGSHWRSGIHREVGSVSELDLDEGERLLGAAKDSPPDSQEDEDLLDWLDDRAPALIAAARERDALKMERETANVERVRYLGEIKALATEIERERKIVHDLRLYLFEDLPSLDWPKWEPEGVDAGAEDYACVVAEHGLKVICQHRGHEPIRDQCGKPEHDYCPVCMSLTPGEAAPRG